MGSPGESHPADGPRRLSSARQNGIMVALDLRRPADPAAQAGPGREDARATGGPTPGGHFCMILADRTETPARLDKAQPAS